MELELPPCSVYASARQSSCRSMSVQTHSSITKTCQPYLTSDLPMFYCNELVVWFTFIKPFMSHSKVSAKTMEVSFNHITARKRKKGRCTAKNDQKQDVALGFEMCCTQVISTPSSVQWMAVMVCQLVDRFATDRNDSKQTSAC